MRRLFAIILLCLLVANAQGAVTLDPYHAITTDDMAVRTSITMSPDGSVVYGWYEGKLYTASGTSWAEVFDSGGTLGSGDLFATATHIFVSPTGTADLYRITPGTPYTWAKVLDFECDAEGREAALWNMAAVGDSLFVGEYAQCAMSETCAYAYISPDAGANWHQVFAGDYRHVHGLWSSAAGDTVFMSLGDVDRQAIKYSADWGGTWSDCATDRQPISCVLSSTGARLWGSDSGTGGNTIARHEGVNTFNTELALVAGHDCFVWAMAGGGTDVAFAGTLARSAASDSCHILRRDTAGDWYSVLPLGKRDSAGYKGISDMCGPDDSGYYYAIDGNVGANRTIRFKDVVKTVGAAGDYATIALAITASAEGDTIILLDDGDTAATNYNLTPKANTTIRVATGVASAHTVWRASGQAAQCLFVLSNAGVVLKNIEIRAANAFTGADKAAINISADATLIGVELRNLTHAGSYAAIFSNGSGCDVIMQDCVLDSIIVPAGQYATRFAGCGRVVFESGSVTNCVTAAGRPPLFIYSSADTARVNYSLFANNSSADYGAAIRAKADPGLAFIVKHNTFYDNTCATAAHGVVFWEGASATQVFDYNIVYGDGATYVISSGTAYLDNARYNDCYNNGNTNTINATSVANNVTLDPLFVTTALDSTRAFMPQECGTGNGPRYTGDLSYMGWFLPTKTPAPTLSAPANGLTGQDDPTLTWNTVAHADSYALYIGSACGSGTYATTADTTYASTTSPGKTYYWQTRSRACDGWGPWSSCYSFGAQRAGDSGERRRRH